MQQEVIEVLEKAKKPMSRTQIAKELEKDLVIVSHAISKLIKFREIKCIEIDRNQAMEMFHCKRRMRLYYTGSR